MKRLGQHFLKNKSKIKKIIEVLAPKENETIIEIGAGHGELTDKLVIKNPKLKIIAIEKDIKLSEKLQKKFKTHQNIEIINDDVLKILPNLIKNKNPKNSSQIQIKNYKILGNIPYYLTGRLLKIISELELKPKLIVLTVQKEVAERICAKPPKMNLLAAAVQFWAKPEIVEYISKKDFQPMPKVNSAIIRLKPLKTSLPQIFKEKYYQLIKIVFKQPRKTILNNLKNGLKLEKTEIIRKLSLIKVKPEKRPQDLAIKQLKKLIPILYN
jgi:16S rRNA (adenine1518-N6/adenine1519-N6)-dimethyltransferase